MHTKYISSHSFFRSYHRYIHWFNSLSHILLSHFHSRSSYQPIVAAGARYLTSEVMVVYIYPSIVATGTNLMNALAVRCQVTSGTEQVGKGTK